MEHQTNESFPRGGRRKEDKHKKRQKRRSEESIFNEPEVEKKARNATTQEHMAQTLIKLQGILTYKTMQSGMVILACVRHISNFTLQIEFPGLTFGIVMINQISDSFTNTLTRTCSNNEVEISVGLKDLFALGQLVPAKVLSLEKGEKGYEVQATLNPNDINSDKAHTSFKKNSLVWANVVSELDHGYEMTVGVKNCRIFLPFENVDDSKTYGIGEVLFCVVQKVENSQVATTLTVSAKQQHINKVHLEDELNICDILPGTKVEFVVEKVLSNGVKGYYLENNLCYLDETQTCSKMDIKKIKEGAVLSAHVLYVEPITKVTYLTLRSFDATSKIQTEIGKIIGAVVLSVAPRGLYLKLGNDELGFITNKRLLRTLKKSADANITDLVRKKYPIGSRHSCRVLDYSHLQQLYICTFEQSLIKEKVFCEKDLHLGQNVTVKVEKVVSNGVVVKTGNVQGFVPNLHLCSTKYSENIKKKYSLGMTFNARVLNITSNENIIFTLKKTLVETDKALANIENAQPGSQYAGFVVQTKPSGALVAFFGNVKGWISSHVLNDSNSGSRVDPREYFFIGQEVYVSILESTNERLQLSLSKPVGKKRKR